MNYPTKVLQALLLWQFVKLSSSQFMQPMPYPGPMGPPMGPPGPPQQMQMPPMPPMPMGPMGPMPMPMPIGLAQPKLPVVVMPYAKNPRQRRPKKKSRKRKKKYKKSDSDESCSDSDTDSSSSSSSSSSDETRRSNRRSGGGNVRRRHQVLTPVISYVTKDGYVVYQKKIKKERAKEWLDLGNKRQAEDQNNLMEYSSAQSDVNEDTMKQIKHKYKQGQKKHNKHKH